MICFLKNSVKKLNPSYLNYICTTALMADDLPVFELLRNLYVMYHTPDEAYTLALLICGLFRSKNILDSVTDGGKDFIKEDMPSLFRFCEPFNNYLCSSCFMQPQISQSGDDMGITWLKNIYDMYFRDADPDKAYEIIDYIARLTGLVVTEDTQLYANFFGNDHEFDMYVREIKLLLMFGHKTNDLSNLVMFNTNTLNELENSSEFTGFVDRIAGDEPFVDISERLTSWNTDESVLWLADRLPNKLTVKLTDYFYSASIEKLRGKVRFEFDIENSKTAERLGCIFRPVTIDRFFDKELVKAQKKSVRSGKISY